ncbi:MAG: ACT domain-containing protein [Anaerolineales bacterium]|jgi:hypothetical protein
MSGESDLSTLLNNMQPILHESPYVFCSVDAETYERLPFKPLGTFFEAEGVSIILDEEEARDCDLPYDSIWACITLDVHSSLNAVGFLAAITNKLAEAGISVNPVSAYYHDHLFVPWDSRARALDTLRVMGDRH